jgi:hypothetical protein
MRVASPILSPNPIRPFFPNMVSVTTRESSRPNEIWQQRKESLLPLHESADSDSDGWAGRHRSRLDVMTVESIGLGLMWSPHFYVVAPYAASVERRQRVWVSKRM